jgi:4-hydroxybenzoate polyprenyltransferase
LTDTSTSAVNASGAGTLESLAVSVLHRMDAWGVAMVSGGLALWLHDAISAGSLVLVGTLGLAYGIGYAVNDYYDAPDDALDEQDAHRNFFVGHPQKTSIIRVVLVVALVPMFAGFAVFGPAGVAAFGIAVFMVFAYSAPPFRFKNRPGMDLLVHACFVQTYPYVVCVLLGGGTWSATDNYMVSINFLASLSGQLAQQIRDLEVDLKTSRTFVTWAGPATSSYFLKAVTLALGAVTVTGFVSGQIPWLLLPLTFMFAPAFLARLRGSGQRSRRVQTLVTALAMIYVAWLFAAV